MDGKFFHAETVETPVRCVKIRFAKIFVASEIGEATEEALLALEEFVNRHLAKGYVHFNLDLESIPFLPPRLIALLIALTVRVRRRQGDIKLLNVALPARQSFSAFSALNFLTVAPPVKNPPEAPKPLPAEIPAKTMRRQPVVAVPVNNETPPIIRASVNDIDLTEFMQTLPIVSVPGTVAEIQAPALHKTGLLNEEEVGLADIAEPPLVEEIARKIETSVSAEDEKRFELRVESQAANLYRLCDFVTAHAFAAGVSEKDIAKMKIAVYEACLNVIEHAYHSRADEWIDLHVRYSPAQFMIVIQDYGLGFEMKPPKDYDVQEVIDERRSGGFGLHIIRRAMDSVEYLADTINGNRLIMIKNLN
jgi:serine/threonine-protein kinase RsbW